MPLRIGLVVNGGRSWMGGVEYIKNIVFALKKYQERAGEEFRVSLIVNNDIEKELFESIFPLLENIYYREEFIRRSSLTEAMTEWYQRTLKHRHFYFLEKFLDDNFDFVFPYFSFEDRPLLVKYASWLPDFQHKYLKEFFSQEEIVDRDDYFLKTAARAPLVVLSSRMAEADFRKFFPQYAHKTTVLPFRTIPDESWFENDPAMVQQRYHLPDRFFIVCNQFWQHKNHLLVFEALSILQQQGIRPIVVCTGHFYDHRFPAYTDRVLQMVNERGLAEQVYFLGLLAKYDQIQLVRHSQTVIQPSLFEGWSSVVEDARCLGKPIILSDIEVHKEQNPPLCRFFERTSSTNLAEKMAVAWEGLSPGPDLAEESVARARNREEVLQFAEGFLEIAKFGLRK